MRDLDVEKSRRNLTRWNEQRQSQNVIDKRPTSDFSYYLQAVKDNNTEDIKFWNRTAKLTDAELEEINKAKIAQRDKKPQIPGSR